MRVKGGGGTEDGRGQVRTIKKCYKKEIEEFRNFYKPIQKINAGESKNIPVLQKFKQLACVFTKDFILVTQRFYQTKLIININEFDYKDRTCVGS